MPRYERVVNERSRLTGRNLEPWRALLSVAAWLDDRGVYGLWDRISSLSEAYQRERRDIEREDLPALIVRALLRLTQGRAADVCDAGDTEAWSVKILDLTEEVRSVAEERDPYPDLDALTPRRVGRLMGGMRFRKDPERSRTNWLVTAGELARWAASFSLGDQTPGTSAADSGESEADESNERSERAAVLEFDGGVTRSEADRLAGLIQA